MVIYTRVGVFTRTVVIYTRVGVFYPDSGVSFVILGHRSPWGRYFLTFLDFLIKHGISVFLRINTDLRVLENKHGFAGFRRLRALVKTIIFVFFRVFRCFRWFCPFTLTESRGFGQNKRLFYPK